MNKAAQAAAQALDQYLRLNPGATSVFGPTRQLYEQVVLLGHTISGRHPSQLPAFKAAYGDDRKAQSKDAAEALGELRLITLRAIEGPANAEGKSGIYLQFKVDPCGIHSGELCVSPYGIPNILTPEAVNALANYAHEWVSGNELIPRSEFEHNVEGDQPLWARLLQETETILGSGS